MHRRIPARSLGAAAAALSAAALTATAVSAGYVQSNFEGAGAIGASSVTGYPASPAILNTASGSVTVPYTVTVHRYAGPNHVSFQQAIDVPLDLRVRHVQHITGVTDPLLAFGDPVTATSTAWSEGMLLAQVTQMTAAPIATTVSPSPHFTVHFPALPDGTTASVAAQQSHTYTFAVTIPKCGYYEIETGAWTNGTPVVEGAPGTGGSLSCTPCPGVSTPGTPGGDQGGAYFAVLTRGFVRATSCETPSVPSSPTTGQVAGSTAPAHGAVTTPTTGAGDGSAGAALLGIGSVIMAVLGATRRRRLAGGGRGTRC